MKINGIIFLLMLFSFPVFSQSLIIENEEENNTYNIGAGYSYSFANPNEKNFHLLNVGIYKTLLRDQHVSGIQYGLASDIVLNANKFTIGPKLRALVYYHFFILGAELVSYTNFENWNLRAVPFFGIGFDMFQLTLNPQISIYNKNYQPIDYGLINLSINYPIFKKKRNSK